MSDQPNKDFFTYFDNTVGVIRKIPIIGKILYAMLYLIVAMTYWFLICTHIVAIIMPFQCIRGLIDPKSVEGQFPFIERKQIEDIGRPPTRWEYVIPLLPYILIIGTIVFVIFREFIGKSL